MTSYLLVAILFSVCLGLANSQCVPAFRVASYYASNMVLQRAPARARIWGYAANVGDQVIINLETGGQTLVVNAFTGPDGSVIWEGVFQPITAPGPYGISIQQGAACIIQLTNILVGDVWVCSGQSNMQHSMNQLDDPQPDLDDSVNYPMVRTFFAGLEWADTPLYDLRRVERNWAQPNAGNLAGFSAICWLFGRNLFRKYGRPVGMIESNWGGTRIEAWTSPEALNECFTSVPPNGPPNGASQLYNSMIHPFLPMPIYGAIWYQGESNTGNANLYGCAIKAMVNDWRSRWHQFSPDMNPSFPFGQVQLAPWRNQDIVAGFPDVRWTQTYGFGHVPNAELVNHFIAVAIDLPDYSSPWGDIHPRYKRPIADRLSLAAQVVAYGDSSDGIYQGPEPTGFAVSASEITVTYSVLTELRTMANNYFEFCCGPTSTSLCTGSGGRWVSGQFLQNEANPTLTIRMSNPCNEGESVTGYRYLWRESPCPLLNCPLYSSQNSLPAPPVIHHGHLGSTNDN